MEEIERKWERVQVLVLLGHWIFIHLPGPRVYQPFETSRAIKMANSLRQVHVWLAVQCLLLFQEILTGRKPGG